MYFEGRTELGAGSSEQCNDKQQDFKSNSQIGEIIYKDEWHWMGIA